MNLTLGTSSVLGKLDNVYFDDKQITNIPCTDNIVGIFSNYINTCTIKTQKKYTKFFNSQITFLILYNGNIYNIKLFVNGTFLLTGYKYEDNTILYNIINILIHYINNNIKWYCIPHDIRLNSIKKILENYKCVYKNKIDLYKLFDVIDNIKNQQLKINKNDYFINNEDIYPIYINKDDWEQDKHIIENIYTADASNLTSVACSNTTNPNSYIKFNSFHIKYLKFTESKGGKIFVKTETKHNSIIYNSTLKIFYSGKINIDGKHVKDVAELYKNWLLTILP